MKKLFILFTSALLVSVGQSQSFECPTFKRNNGNNSNCPGEQVTRGNSTSIPVAVNSSLNSSDYSIPTSDKEGNFTLEFDQQYSNIPLIGDVSVDGSKVDVEFGPPSNWDAKSNSYSLDYCFYKNNLAPANKIMVMVIRKQGSSSNYGTCVYDNEKLVSGPKINTHPSGVLNICKGENHTFSISAAGSRSNTSLSYQWKKNGTAISGATSSSLALSSLTSSNDGDYTVVVTETDVHGNAMKLESNVAKLQLDKIAPTAKAKNFTIELDETGNATINEDHIDNGSTDNCGIKGRSLDKTKFTCEDRGKDHTVTLTVEDAQGNKHSATGVVSVVDKIAPTAKAKNYIAELDETGNATIKEDDIDDDSKDNCGIKGRSLDKTKFTCEDRGKDHTVTLTVEDAQGNKHSATGVVSVVDKIAPTAKTKNIEISITNGADVTIAASDINNGSTDNCGINKYIVTGNKTKFGCSDRGKTFTVTLTTEDASGNSASKTATVTVKGSLTQTPTITKNWNGLNNDGNYYYPFHSDKAKFTATTANTTNYTYSWSGNDISGSKTESYVYLLPTKEGKIALTATAKDADGCTASATASLCVFDVAVPNTSNNKVYVCHDKGSNSVGATGFVTLEVAISGAVNHLTQHSKDKIGASCGSFDCTKLSSRSKSVDENTVVGQLFELGDHMSVVVYPNPSNDVFIIEVESEELTNVSKVIISDMMGRVVETATMNPNVAIEVGRELIPGMYNITVSNGGMVSSSRLIKR